eukprot:GEMP01059551.1.p1 GENE.GEMP01059551.1~~GEMP01059551.1.p1  ORF type:complete len:159 (+),score=20.45 GEMP01059551.1:105-581(+)
MATKRLMAERREMERDVDPDIQLSVAGDTLETWNARVVAPAGCPYDGGIFYLRLDVPGNYPMVPPTVTFITKCFHPNIKFESGELCLDILKADWSPAWTLRYVCRAVIALLIDPNADSPLNCDAGNLIRSGDSRGFSSLARMYTKEYAIASQVIEPCI